MYTVQTENGGACIAHTQQVSVVTGAGSCLCKLHTASSPACCTQQACNCCSGEGPTAEHASDHDRFSTTPAHGHPTSTGTHLLDLLKDPGLDEGAPPNHEGCTAILLLPLRGFIVGEDVPVADDGHSGVCCYLTDELPVCGLLVPAQQGISKQVDV